MTHCAAYSGCLVDNWRRLLMEASCWQPSREASGCGHLNFKKQTLAPWFLLWNMNLYRLACSDLQPSKACIQKSNEPPLKFKRQSMVPKMSSPVRCWLEGLSSQTEEKFLLMHGLPVQQTDKAAPGMRYRYLPICLQRLCQNKLVKWFNLDSNYSVVLAVLFAYTYILGRSSSQGS